jgi:hypothetical protein
MAGSAQSTYSALPPSSIAPEMDGEFPNALADRALHLHSGPSASTSSSAGSGWLTSLGRTIGPRGGPKDDDAQAGVATALAQDEQEGLLGDIGHSDEDEDVLSTLNSRKGRKRSDHRSRKQPRDWQLG